MIVERGKFESGQVSPGLLLLYSYHEIQYTNVLFKEADHFCQVKDNWKEWARILPIRSIVPTIIASFTNQNHTIFQRKNIWKMFHYFENFPLMFEKL